METRLRVPEARSTSAPSLTSGAQADVGPCVVTLPLAPQTQNLMDAAAAVPSKITLLSHQSLCHAGHSMGQCQPCPLPAGPGTYVGDGAAVGAGALRRCPCAGDAPCDAAAGHRAQSCPWKTHGEGIRACIPPHASGLSHPQTLLRSPGMTAGAGVGPGTEGLEPHLEAQMSPGPWACPGSRRPRSEPEGTAAPASRH